jgi:ABC-type multidrug transport system ATPase subunit
LLDEPMSGLDQQAQDDVRVLLKKLASKTLIYASHDLDEIEEFTSSVIIMHEGKIVQQLNLKELDQEIFLLEIDPGIKPHLNRFEHLNPRITSDSSPQIELLLTADSSSFQKFIDFCNSNNVHIHRIRSRSLLEHMYYKYISA